MVQPPQPPEKPRGSVVPDPALLHARALLEALGEDPSGLSEGAVEPGKAARDWARSGAMLLTGAADGPPEFACGPLASVALGAGRAIEALAPEPFVGNRDWAALLGERAALFELTRRGASSAGGSARLIETRTGTITLNLPREDDRRLVPAWLEAPLSPDLALSALWPCITRECATRDGAALVARARLMGMAAAPAPRTPDPKQELFMAHHASEARPPGDPRGLRVLDLSTLWAGPLAGSLLVDAGFDVLKVESRARPDGARSGSIPFFDLMNSGKRSLALDLHDRADRATFEALLDAADIVLESARPRALTQLGYDASAWVTSRPGRLWASITGYGRHHEWIAFGDDAAIAAGLAWSPTAGSRSSREARPRFCADAIADPLTGLHVAAALLGHVKAGRGGLLEFALRDVAAHAAGAASDALTLPIVRKDDSEWALQSERERIPLALPRARAPRGSAPALGAHNTIVVSQWTASSC